MMHWDEECENDPGSGGGGGGVYGTNNTCLSVGDLYMIYTCDGLEWEFPHTVRKMMDYDSW